MKRYEREIEEILQKIVDFPSDSNARRRAKRPGLWSQIRHRIPPISLSFTTNNLTVAAVILTILGFALHDYAPRVAPLASMAAVVLFVAIIYQSFQHRRTRYEKRWRGQVIQFPSKQRTPWNELRFRLTILWRSLRWWISQR